MAVGLQSQIERNTYKTILLLCTFPIIILFLIWLVAYAMSDNRQEVWHNVTAAMPWVLGAIAIWFVIAYFYNVTIVRNKTCARPLLKRENPRIYNIVENLSLTAGIEMPAIDIVNTRDLNAYACGIDRRSYTIGVTKGLLDDLDDRELEGVMAHEITHIANNDTRLSIVSTVFVGIFSVLVAVSIAAIGELTEQSGNSKDDDNGWIGVILALIGLIISAIGLFLSTLTHFSISRKREYLADAGASELTSDPLALASALRKIANRPAFDSLSGSPISQIFIFKRKKRHSSLTQWWHNLFATHPPINKRIELLEQF